jgi:pantetheine-phosphate adenylyltransferase
MKKAIYPGSFDPITNGHIDIVRRARKMFDEVIIAVAKNPEKKPFFSYDEREKMISQIFSDDPSIKVLKYSGLLVNLAKETGIYTFIRGLRAVTDFDYEFQLAMTNKTLNTKIDTVFLMTDGKYSYLSSNVVRQLAKFNGDISSFVPALVEFEMKRKMT